MALIVVSMSGLFIERTRFLKALSSKNLVHFMVVLTRSFGVGLRLNEPEFIPIRIGILCFFASVMIALSFSLSLMLAGLMRILSAPFLMAARARSGSKWMSAMRGIEMRVLIFGRASAAFLFGIAMRMRSQPSFSSSFICLTVCATFSVGVSHIDWIVILRVCVISD